jgi:hypothetical protein
MLLMSYIYKKKLFYDQAKNLPDSLKQDNLEIYGN